MIATISQQFTFDAAHTLDRSESSRRVHGHTYHCEVSWRGIIRDDGMVTDLANLRASCEVPRMLLDHQLLDEVPGLGIPTMEWLCVFILKMIPMSFRVKVWRADGGSCTVDLDERHG